MLGKAMRYGSVFLAAFYIGNVAPVNLPSPNDIAGYFSDSKRELRTLEKKLQSLKNKTKESAEQKIKSAVDKASEQKDALKILEKKKKDLEEKLKSTLQKMESGELKPGKMYSDKNSQASALENYMIELVNEQRKLHGVHELKYSKQGLFDAARQHSREMMELDYFSHESPVKEYRTLGKRLKIAGEDVIGGGENLAMVGSCAESFDRRFVETAMFGGRLDKMENIDDKIIISVSGFKVDDNCSIASKKSGGLMNSEGHRENILFEDYDYIGIGIVTGKIPGEDIYGMWATQVFARYPDED